MKRQHFGPNSKCLSKIEILVKNQNLKNHTMFTFIGANTLAVVKCYNLVWNAKSMLRKIASGNLSSSKSPAWWKWSTFCYSRKKWSITMTPFLTGSKILYQIWPPKLFFSTVIFISFEGLGMKKSASIRFFNYWTKISLMGHWKYDFLLILVRDA